MDRHATRLNGRKNGFAIDELHSLTQRASYYSKRLTKARWKLFHQLLRDIRWSLQPASNSLFAKVLRKTRYLGQTLDITDFGHAGLGGICHLRHRSHAITPGESGAPLIPCAVGGQHSGYQTVVNIYHSTAPEDSVATESCPVDDLGGSLPTEPAARGSSAMACSSLTMFLAARRPGEIQQKEFF
jgi:hypothetical protein